jgi:hypothetical protein
MPAGRKPALLWFRNDLRLHDHEPLAAACAGATSLLPVYVFDPREYGKVRELTMFDHELTSGQCSKGVAGQLCTAAAGNWLGIATAFVVPRHVEGRASREDCIVW